MVKHGQAEGEGDADEADADFRKFGGKDSGAAAAEDKPECAEKLGRQFTGQEISFLIFSAAQPLSYRSRACKDRSKSSRKLFRTSTCRTAMPRLMSGAR
jgi:hypothetical protein